MGARLSKEKPVLVKREKAQIRYNDYSEESLPNNRSEWHSCTDKLMTDFVIKVGDYIFHVQKDLITYYSGVLREFLDKNATNMITLLNIEPEILKIVLHYMYTTDLKVNIQNMVEVYRAAGSLRIKEIMAKCIQVNFYDFDISSFRWSKLGPRRIIETLPYTYCFRKIIRSNDPNAHLYKYTVSWMLRVECAKHESLLKILRDLERCIAEKEFMNLDVEQICEIFTAAGLDWTNSNIESFYHLFLVALKWIDFNQKERLPFAVAVMGCVPFRKMSNQELRQCFDPPFAKHVAFLPGVKAIIQAAMT